MTMITFHHLVAWLKARIGNLCYRRLFMVGFLSRDYIIWQREVGTGIGHQVGLEFGQINIQGSIKPEGSSDWGHNLVNINEEKDQEIGNQFEKIMTENFPNLVKEIDIEVQKAQRVPNKMDAKRPTPRQIIIKVPNIKDKEKILKEAKEKSS